MRVFKLANRKICNFSAIIDQVNAVFQSLRHQLLGLNTSVIRIERQIHHLADLQLKSADASIFPPPSLRMLSVEGNELGYAYLLNDHHIKDSVPRQPQTKQPPTTIKTENPKTLEPIKAKLTVNSFSSLTAGRDPRDLTRASSLFNASTSPLFVSPAGGGGGGFARGSRGPT